MTRARTLLLTLAILGAGGCSAEKTPDDDAAAIENEAPAPVDARAEAGEAPPFSAPRAKISPAQAAPVEDEASRRRSVR